jgi:ABC-type transport system substrate-binding protein
MTADDVVFSFIRVYESDKAMRGTMEGIESITAPDKWTVVFKVADVDGLRLGQ